MFPYENWTGDIAQSINGKRLSEICIPATHNSGAYALRASDPATELWGLPWANNQSLPISLQLLWGIRALDLRLIYTGDPNNAHPNLNDVRLTHTSGGDYPHMTTYLGRPVEEEIKTIAEFLQTHPKEILIVWFHKTYRFNTAVHRLVGECLNRHLFQHHMQPSYRKEKIGELVRLGRRVIVRYEDAPPELLQRCMWMWTKSEDSWAYTYTGSTKIEKMRDDIGAFLDRNAAKRGDGNLYYAELQLTEGESDIIKSVAAQPLTVAMMGFAGGLLALGPAGALGGALLGAISGAIASHTHLTSTLQMAVLSNILAYAWLRTDWAKKANIVALDYFEQSGQLLEIVKRINQGQIP
jgi:hypothetical protein